MSQTKKDPYEGRKFNVDVYDKDYFEGDGDKSGYQSYANAKGIVTDHFQIIHEVMWPRVSGDGEATIHIDVACAYGFGVAKMKSLGWVSCGGDISEFAIAEGKRLLGEDIEIAVSDARKPKFWKGFDKLQACDLVTGSEFFEHIDGEDIDTVLGYMQKSSRWGAFCINGATAPADPTKTEDEHDHDEGHLNHFNMAWWIDKIAEYGEIDFEAMYELSKRSEAYNKSVHWQNRWVVVKFNENIWEESDENTKAA